MKALLLNFISKIDTFTEYNVGLTKKEIIDRFESFKFTLETLEWILYSIKINTVSFNGTCGPFLEKGGRIYNIKCKKNDTINALVVENTRLKKEICELKERLAWREDLHKHQYV